MSKRSFYSFFVAALRIERIAPTKIFASRSDVIFSVVATTDDHDADDNEEEAEQGRQNSVKLNHKT
jgi:hypothetical protein